MALSLYPQTTSKVPHGALHRAVQLLPTDYLFELIVDGRVVRSVTLPIGPEAIQLQRPGATTLEYTIGTAPVREHSRFRRTNIEISGRSGIATRSGHDHAGALVSRGGAELVQLFDRFLAEAQEAQEHRFGVRATGSGQVSRATDAYVVFRAFPLGLAVRVEVTDWTLRRDVRDSRFGWTFRLQLHAYAPAPDRAPPSLLGSSVSSVLAASTAAVQATADYIAYAEVALRATTQASAELRAPLLAAGRAAQQLQRVAAGVRSVSQIPAETLRATGRVFARLASAWQELVASRDELVTGSEASWRALQRDFGTLIHNTRSSCAEAAGYVHGSRAGTAAAPLDDGSAALVPASAAGDAEGQQAPIGDAQQTVPASVNRAGMPYVWGWLDTVALVASVFLGTPDAAADIVDANNLLDPYTKADGSPLSPGDVLIIPTPDAPADAIDANIYLTDLALDDDGDLRINGDGDDAVLVNGAANIRQALWLRSLTVAGDVPFYPAYGMPELIGTPNNAGLAAYVAGQATDQYLRDLRVAEVLSASVRDGGDRFELLADVRVQSAVSAIQIVTPLG